MPGARWRVCSSQTSPTAGPAALPLWAPPRQRVVDPGRLVLASLPRRAAAWLADVALFSALFLAGVDLNGTRCRHWRTLPGRYGTRNTGWSLAVTCFPQ